MIFAKAPDAAADLLEANVSCQMDAAALVARGQAGYAVCRVSSATKKG